MVAESFAQALASLARFRGGRPESPVAWLYGIAANLLRQWHRDRRVEREGRERLGMPVRAYAEFDEDVEVEARVDALALGQALRVAMRTLPDAQREALRLRVLDDLEYAEIAAVLHLSEPTARQRVSRALRTLNSRLKGAGA
jgi:RNA polymerase sigma-70 factor (ECF subfamily)